MARHFVSGPKYSASRSQVPHVRGHLPRPRAQKLIQHVIPSIRNQQSRSNRRVHVKASHVPTEAVAVTGGGDDGGDSGQGNNGGGGDDGDDETVGLEEALALAAAAGAKLPKDFLAAAADGGIKLCIIQKYLGMQDIFLMGWLSRVSGWFRGRLLYDDRFLFKVLAEICIDSGCATVAEVRKRGDEFWDEFEFYLSDLMVGLVLDVVLVGLLAPVAVLGKSRPQAKGGLAKMLDKVPSAVFAASQSGRTFSPAARFACVFVKFLEYSIAGMACGLIGQSIANAAMMTRRNMNPDEVHTVEPPPLIKTALVWGLFMGASSNLRYQAVYGLERIVDLTIAKKVPQIAYGTTIAIRFANNIVGGENFIDMARWAGVQ